MFNLIKWNSIDFFRNSSWVWIGMAVSLLLALIPINGNGVWNASMILLSGTIGIIVFQAGIVLALFFCFRWLEKASHLLELSLPFSAWKILFAKLLVAGFVNLVSGLFLMQLWVVMGKYKTGALQLLSLGNLKSVAGLALFLMVVDCTILLSYLVSKSMRMRRGMSLLVTGGLSLVIFGAVTVGVVTLMAVSGVLILPVVSGTGILTINGSLQVLSTLVPVCVGLGVVLLEYAGSCLLLTYSFQES